MITLPKSEYSSLETGHSRGSANAATVTRHNLLSLALIYMHLGLAIAGWLPLWSLLLSIPILVVRWILSLHDLFHLRNATEVSPLIRWLPLLLTPLSLGYREYLDIHRRHHYYMATPRDPEYYQIQGNQLNGLLNALMVPEQAYFRWVMDRGMDGSLLKSTLIRLILFIGLIAVSGPSFLWYWIPLRLVYGISHFIFFYCLHRRGAEYGVYPLHFPTWGDRLIWLLFGNDALLAICHHDRHHQGEGYPR